VRGKHDIRLWLDTFYFEADHRFSTSHDYKVAKIIANDLIQVYLEDRLNNINVKKGSDNSLKWTASKTALTELIYALYSHGVFNNGNTDIKLIAKTFEDAFNIELGDFYHTFMELKARKINRTKFLDSLCEALIKKMDEQGRKVTTLQYATRQMNAFCPYNAFLNLWGFFLLFCLLRSILFGFRRNR
jgi:hypothetical protein